MWTIIPTLSANVVREVELIEAEEISRNEYRHCYGDGSDTWCAIYEDRHEAIAEANRYGRYVHVEG